MGLFDFFHKLVGGDDENSSSASGAAVKPEQKYDAVSAEDSLRNLENFVEYVVKALVDYPDEVRISTADAEVGKMIQISCRVTDRGKIIGKKGKTIMALRSLISGAAGRSHCRVSVEVLDDEETAKE